MDTIPSPEAKNRAGRLTSAASFYGLLRYWEPATPNAVALTDPPNRAELGLGTARVLTFAEIDELVDFKKFLAEKQIAPYKLPDQLIITKTIPWHTDGEVQRARILSEL